jgi:hypothetical protein
MKDVRSEKVGTRANGLKVQTPVGFDASSANRSCPSKAITSGARGQYINQQ